MASQVCNQCSHVNPPDASYCYYDGVRLAGGAGGPVNAGAQNFPSQFVFPSGLVARNFDQLATTCQQNWPQAVGLLKDGMFANFFSGIGRADLVQAAKEAARFPDLDRGLDQFLAKLPTNALQDPKLKVEPTEINLGTMSYGTDRTIELKLENAGMRLLYGSVASDCKWLTLGTAPGSQQKMFQFGSDLAVPLNIRGKELRASPKPLEGQLLIDSNGGPPITVTIKVTVPIVPFKDGVLAGAKSPREIAEKARPKAQEAAQFFENGAVADWFKKNGWTYPVQGPSAIGMGAVQQFFEALGLAKAPKVDISVKSLSLSGAPGEKASATIDVTTQEKKMVYAHATCEQPWVDVSKVKLAGRTAQITVNVPSIPQRPGETLQTKIHIAGNGNQRFSVPLSVTVSGTPGSAPRAAPAANPFAFQEGPGSPIVKPSAASPGRAPDGAAAPKKQLDPRLIHLIPLGVLFLGLFIFLIHDIFWGKAAGFGFEGPDEAGDKIEPYPKMIALFDYEFKDVGDSGVPYAHKNMNFGVWEWSKQGQPKQRLVFGKRGQTNNTSFRIDGRDYTFGKPGTGEWVKDADGKETPRPIWWDKDSSGKPLLNLGSLPRGAIAAWKVKTVTITQMVKIKPGESVEVSTDDFRRYYDTCEVIYEVKNDGAPVDFAMRILFDTLIGEKPKLNSKGEEIEGETVENDGVPFVVPGLDGLQLEKKFSGSNVPDFISAQERDDLKDPGTVVQLNLRLGGKIEAPETLLLTKWPGPLLPKTWSKEKKIDATNEAIEKWDVPLADPRKDKNNPDSAVVMYWTSKQLTSSEPRFLGYTYSLGSNDASAKSQLALKVGGVPVVGNEITVVALVSKAKKGETVTLDPPAGFTVISEKTQPVPPHETGSKRPSPVTWKLKANQAGVATITVRTSEGAEVKKRINIRATTIY